MSEVAFVTWADRVGGSLARKKINALGHSFKVGPAGIQQVLVADERKDLKENRMAHVKVRQISVPRSSIILPTFWARHPLGFVVGAVEVGLPKSIEESRTIDEVAFYPMADGSIQANDVLGVVNLLYAEPEYIHELFEKAPADYAKDRYWFG